MSIEHEITQLLNNPDQLMWEQHQRETTALQLNAEQALAKAKTLEKHSGLNLFSDFTEELIVVAAAHIEGLKAARMAGLRLQKYDLITLMCTPEQIAAYFYDALMQLVTNPEQGVFKKKLNLFTKHLGIQLELQSKYNAVAAIKAGKDVGTVGEFNEMMAAMDISSKSKRESMKNFKDLFDRHLNTNNLMSLGETLTNVLLPVMGDRVEIRKLSDGTNGVFYVVIPEAITDVAYERFMDEVTDAKGLGFMICPPRPLTIKDLHVKNRYMTRLFYKQQQDMLVPSEAALRSANHLQSQAMTVNAAVVDVLSKLTREQADQAAGINTAPYKQKKDEDAEKYASRLKKQRMSIYEKRKLFSSTVKAAQEALQYDAVYFPTYLDFRGRVYSVDQGGLGPQGTKIGRSLLMPAGPGKVVGMSALFHELGNVWGFDKDVIGTKIEKAKALPYAAIAADPLANTEWLAADEPAKALACCIEIAAAEASEDPEAYVSKLFIAFDGTNNGLQHLALLTRDADAAAATNVKSIPSVRRDIYVEVAQAAAAKLDNDTITNHPKLRTLAKTPVMTVPYGVTAKGMLDQIVEANDETGGLLSDEEVKAFRDAIQSSIRDLMPAPMAFADWIVAVTRLIAEDDVEPTWITPSGSFLSPARHKDYSTYGRQQVKLCGRKTTLPNFAKPEGINVGKHVSGSIANMIHSLDADCLHLTVCKLLDAGVTDIIMIHDSYSVLSGDAEVLARVLREVHAEVYGADVLGQLHQHLQSLTDVELPSPPALGDLDVADVLTSDYFFS